MKTNSPLIAVSLFLISVLTLGCVRRGGVEEGALPTYPAATAGDDGAASPPPQDDAAVRGYTEDVLRCAQVVRAQGRRQAAERSLTGDAADAFVDALVLDECSKSRPAPGVQLPVAPATDESAPSESVASVLPPPSTPSSDDTIDEDPAGKHLQSFVGVSGDTRPSGCSGVACLHIAGVPFSWGRPTCSGISMRVDDRDVLWKSAGRIVTARVNPGEGFESLGLNRVSILRAGEHGFIFLTAPADGNGNGHPAALSAGDHAIEATCWDMTQRSVMIGGHPRLVRFVTRLATYRASMSTAMGSVPEPLKLPVIDGWSKSGR